MSGEDIEEGRDVEVVVQDEPGLDEVDLANFDHLPIYRGLSWTFGALPTLCPRGHRKKPLPPCISEFHNKYLVLKLFITYNFQANLAYRPILLKFIYSEKATKFGEIFP